MQSAQQNAKTGTCKVGKKEKKTKIELDLAFRETDVSLWQYNYAHFNQNLIIIIKKPYSVNNNGKVLHWFNTSHNSSQCAYQLGYSHLNCV